MIKVQNRYFGRKAITVATLGALVVSTMAPLGGMQQAEAESMSADGYVTAAASRAAQTAPEILGLTGVEETSGSTGAAGWGTLDWKTPKYNIFGETQYNTAANPYMVNAVSVQQGIDKNASPTIVLNEARAGGGRGPMGALATYGSDETDDAVWNMKPDVVIGTGTKSGVADYDSASYIGSDLYNSGYHPKGVAYKSGENANIISEMYDIAKAGDEVAASTGKKLRYGNATNIAKNYEEYVRGTQGLIMKAIDNKVVKKKTIALVNAYDSTSKTYTLTKPGAELTGAAAGTSETDHYLDMTNSVTDNLATKLNKTTVTASELAKADVVLVGGNSANSKAVAEQLPPSMLSKTYYTDGYNAGAIYDVMHNAVDNIQNAGRILGFIYPEVVDQNDWICYYYSKFYHVKDGKLAEVIDKAMDGVRNADAKKAANYLQWSTADAKGYKASTVQNKLNEGTAYYAKKVTKGVDALTGNIDTKSLKYNDTVKKDNTLKVAKSKVTVKKGKKATVKVSSARGKVTVKSSNKKVATVKYKSGKVTIKGVKKGSAKVTVKAAGNKDYKSATKTIKVTVKK